MTYQSKWAPTRSTPNKVIPLAIKENVGELPTLSKPIPHWAFPKTEDNLSPWHRKLGNQTGPIMAHTLQIVRLKAIIGTLLQWSGCYAKEDSSMVSTCMAFGLRRGRRMRKELPDSDGASPYSLGIVLGGPYSITYKKEKPKINVSQKRKVSKIRKYSKKR